MGLVRPRAAKGRENGPQPMTPAAFCRPFRPEIVENRGVKHNTPNIGS